MLYDRGVRSVNVLRYVCVDALLCIFFMSDDRGFPFSYDCFLVTLFNLACLVIVLFVFM